MSAATAMIIGASSALSQALAAQLSAQNVSLVLFVNDPEAIQPFSLSLPGEVSIYPLTIDQPHTLIAQLNQAWEKHNGAHLVIVNTGVNEYDPALPWSIDQHTIDVNVMGFAAASQCIFKLMCQQGYGQLAAINSIAGQRGGPNVAYHASKAFAANYLQGLSMHAQRLKLPVTISDIQLGLFDKAVHLNTKLLLSPIDNVAEQILTALKKGKRRVYVTKRWRIVAWINRILPEYIYNTRHWKPRKKRG
ncbi:SDR family NAD(P)-dependent oxidoreductase [Shewanella inventionis]|uniref:Short-chain dehydrogenase n=1 Tax=Shewanella inventionis TaxID=1738770 RepID=A0ABQ1J9E6_9GAMM|nr:SDR family NAD(P)-dependent oxidoreductase [Shewanella inventionis]MCL1159181.1 SDR family NAD(P)-dependent oxidoreductase [Shewanella inventionis]GGB61731.1 short-chain dehydrogenase [Shewanella inventionis]